MARGLSEGAEDLLGADVLSPGSRSTVGLGRLGSPAKRKNKRHPRTRRARTAIRRANLSTASLYPDPPPNNTELGVSTWAWHGKRSTQPYPEEDGSKTGLPEEVLFRGLIAGALARRLPLLWANVLQALIFTAPHGLLLLIMPERWGLLFIIFAGSLVAGWMRIKSGSFFAPWIMHASGNVATGLIVAMGTAG